MQRAGAAPVSWAALVALLCMALLAAPAEPAGAQDGGALEFETGTQAAGQASGRDRESGPLAGASVTTRDRDGDGSVDLFLIRREDCTARQGASLVLEDDDGTQGDFVDNRNVQIRNVRGGLRAVSNPPGGNIEALAVRGGDGTLDSGGLTVVTSTGITCEDDDDGGGSGGGASDNQYGDDDGGDGGNGGGDVTGSGGDLDCDDFDSRSEAQEVLDEDSDDPNNLDADGDGTACESFGYGDADDSDADDGDVDDPDDVVAGTGDKGPLPDTGGFPLLLGAAGLLLVAAALAVRRIVAP